MSNIKSFKNNAVWIVDEFTEWITRAIKSVEELCDKTDATTSEYTRLLEKCRTLKMVQGKFEEIKND